MDTKQKLPTIRQFQERFPTEESCLEHLMRTRFGERHACAKCGRNARYHRVKARRAYECEYCGKQVYPTAGTPFALTRTSLRDWFQVMFMFCASRNGVSAKEVQRTIGVTYKTAWRMCNLVRQYMGYVDGDNSLGGTGSGIVEIDEMFVGGKDKRGHGDKVIVLGATERGGETVTKVIPTRASKHVIPAIFSWVKRGTRIATDEAHVYRDLGDNDYRHASINHSKGEYVSGEVHTNTIESFWSHVKRSLAGTYINVSPKWLQVYLWEFEYRQNLRRNPHLMLELLLKSFPRAA